MIQIVFTIYDSKLESHLTPFFQQTTAQAKRVFENAANDKTHQFGVNPADYTLFEIATYNDETALIEPYKTPKSHGLAQEYIRQIPLDLSQPELDIKPAEATNTDDYRKASRGS